MKIFLLLLLALTSCFATPSPLDLFQKRHPKHPAIALGLEKLTTHQAYQAITRADFLAKLAPRQKSALISYRDTLAANLRAAGHADFPPPEGYSIQKVNGWSVFIHRDLLEEQEAKTKRALFLLDHQLQLIIDRVPAPAVTYLKKVPLYFSPADIRGRGGACHHPSSIWLKNNNRPVEMAKTVEFSNIHNFDQETRRMPNFALHELAHAYHNHLLGDDHPDILQAFRRAEKSGTYNNIPRRTGNPKHPVHKTRGPAYAMSNQMEYFAETTEAYFGENDITPFDRAALIEHDPQAVVVLEKVWGVQKTTHPLLAANRIVVIGDSITAAGHYITYLQSALHLKGHAPEIIPLGLGSETASGNSEKTHPFPRPDVHERLDRVLAKTKPDLVIACYGMNDGIYHPFSKERFADYQKGIRKLITKVKAQGAKIILMTPPPFDPVPLAQRKGKLVPANHPDFSYRNIYQNYDQDVLKKYAAWLMTRKNEVTAVIDLHTAIHQDLAGKRKNNPGFTYSPDGIHPNQAGHQFIANTIHQTFFQKPLPEISPALFRFYHQRKKFLHPAWLTHTGHKRPGMKKGLPLDVAQALAAFTLPEALLIGEK